MGKKPNILSPLLSALLTLLIHGSNSILLAHPWEYARRGECISFPEISIPILASEEISHPRLLISYTWNELIQSIPELCEQIGLWLKHTGNAAAPGHQKQVWGTKASLGSQEWGETRCIPQLPVPQGIQQGRTPWVPLSATWGPKNGNFLIWGDTFHWTLQHSKHKPCPQLINFCCSPSLSPGLMSHCLH